MKTSRTVLILGFILSGALASGQDAGPAGQANFEYFRAALAPYGAWTQLPQYGWAWIPDVVTENPLWRPYWDGGHWVQSDEGLYWQSDYAWGAIPFHYGRWVFAADYGWVWVPDDQWGPAWVCWRDDDLDDLCGWAPLPPGAFYVFGAGLYWHGRRAVGCDFGLRPEAFAYCPRGRLRDRDFRRYGAPRDRVNQLFARSNVRRIEPGRSYLTETRSYYSREHAAASARNRFVENRIQRSGSGAYRPAPSRANEYPTDRARPEYRPAPAYHSDPGRPHAPGYRAAPVPHAAAESYARREYHAAPPQYHAAAAAPQHSEPAHEASRSSSYNRR
jgi:hypothetical protein